MALFLTLPARPERIFLFKYHDALLLSSWAFLLLGTPMLLAYGLVAEAPWYYYALLPPALVAFIHIPAAIGAVCCLLLVHRLLRRPGLIGAVALSVVIIGGAWGVFYVRSVLTEQALAPEWFQQIFARLRFTQHRLLPSWWLSTALLEASRHQFTESLAFLGVLLANALFFRQLAVWTAAGLLRRAFAEVSIGRTSRRRVRLHWLDRLTFRLLRPFPMQTRVLLLEGFSPVPTRSAAMDSDSNFLRTTGPVFPEHPAIQLRNLLPGMGQYGQPSEPGCSGPAAIHLHHPVYFPGNQPGRAELLDPRFASSARETLLWSKFWFSVVGTVRPMLRTGSC